MSILECSVRSLVVLFFFFSSRRRHTRCSRDWSSDVCSSDLLTMAGVLKVTANGTTTSPILRGAWVLDRILGTPPPRPTMDIEAVEPDIRGAKTIREQLAKHRDLAECASCHAKIDPPGFALESFDVIGGWREYSRG